MTTSRQSDGSKEVEGVTSSLVEAGGRPAEIGDGVVAADASGRCLLGAKHLALPEDCERMLKLAARLHDEGKRSDRWQNAFSAPDDGRPYAKTPGPVRPRLLLGYRHEFGSLPLMQQDSEFQSLGPEMQDLALHATPPGVARGFVQQAVTGMPAPLPI